MATSLFSDDFNRASGKLGSDWIYTACPDGTVAPINGPGVEIAASSLDGNQCLNFYTIGQVNPLTYWRGAGIALPPSQALRGLSQYCSLDIVRFEQTGGVAANIHRLGPGVLINANGNDPTQLSGYFIMVQVQLLSKLWVLVKFFSASSTANLAVGAAGTVANGDRFSLEATVTPSSVDLIAKRNGTAVATVSDTAATRVTTGSPGLGHQFLGNTIGQTFALEFRNFDCGSL